MVQAILEGRKTQTRRVIKLQPADHYFKSLVLHATGRYTFAPNSNYNPTEKDIVEVKSKFGKVGDVLWVREGFCLDFFDDHSTAYKADWNDVAAEYMNQPKWKPSIHMPKAACRIFLQIKNIRVEKLWDISEEDAIAEGVLQYDDGTYKNYCSIKGFSVNDGVECILAKASFQSLWFEINGMENYRQNPFVWVIEFERIPKPVTFNA